MSEEKMRAALPEFIRRDVERAIEAAVHPKGMSVHDGKALIGADRLQYMLNFIDQAALQESEAGAVEPWKDDRVVWRLSQGFNKPAPWFDERMSSVAYHAAFEFNPGDAGSRNCFMAGARWMSGFLEIVLDSSKELEANAQKAIQQAYELAPPSAKAIETAAIMRAAEAVACPGRTIFDTEKAILALIPRDGRTALEEFGMKCIDGALNLDPWLCTEQNLRAIVTKLIGEKK